MNLARNVSKLMFKPVFNQVIRKPVRERQTGQIFWSKISVCQSSERNFARSKSVLVKLKQTMTDR